MNTIEKQTALFKKKIDAIFGEDIWKSEYRLWKKPAIIWEKILQVDDIAIYSLYTKESDDVYSISFALINEHVIPLGFGSSSFMSEASTLIDDEIHINWKTVGNLSKVFGLWLEKINIKGITKESFFKKKPHKRYDWSKKVKAKKAWYKKIKRNGNNIKQTIDAIDKHR